MSQGVSIWAGWKLPTSGGGIKCLPPNSPCERIRFAVATMIKAQQHFGVAGIVTCTISCCSSASTLPPVAPSRSAKLVLTQNNAPGAGQNSGESLNLSDVSTHVLQYVGMATGLLTMQVFANKR